MYFHKVLIVGDLSDLMSKKKELISYSELDDLRKDCLLILQNVTNELYHKANKGRFHDVKKDKLRLDYWKGVVYSVNTMNSIYKDKQIDELKNDIEELKKGLIIEVPKKEEDFQTENLKKLEELDDEIEKLKE